MVCVCFALADYYLLVYWAFELLHPLIEGQRGFCCVTRGLNPSSVFGRLQVMVQDFLRLLFMISLHLSSSLPSVVALKLFFVHKL